MCETFLTEHEMDNLDYNIWIQSMMGTVGLMKTRDIVKHYRELLSYEEISDARRKKFDKYGRRGTDSTDRRTEKHGGACE